MLGQRFEDDLTRVRSGRRPFELPAFFANILPEGRFREIVESTLSLPKGDPLALLVALGEDLPGAVTIRPSEGTLPDDLRMNEPLVDHEEASEQLGLRFSLAGVQLKFSVAREGDRLVLPARDQRGTWILKVPSEGYPGLCENEFAMLRWAALAGFEVPSCETRTTESAPQLRRWIKGVQTVLLVERYDRAGIRRIHQEDFAQVVGCRPEKKYDFTVEKLMVLVRGILGDEGYLEMMRRFAFVVAVGNEDAHLKNWSLVYSDGIQPELSPLYDQVTTIVWPKLERGLALKWAGTREFSRIDLDSFRRLARKSGGEEEAAARAARETINALRSSWSDLIRDVGLGSDHERALREHWATTPLLRDTGGPLA